MGPQGHKIDIVILGTSVGKWGPAGDFARWCTISDDICDRTTITNTRERVESVMSVTLSNNHLVSSPATRDLMPIDKPKLQRDCLRLRSVAECPMRAQSSALASAHASRQPTSR